LTNKFKLEFYTFYKRISFSHENNTSWLIFGFHGYMRMLQLCVLYVHCVSRLAGVLVLTYNKHSSKNKAKTTSILLQNFSHQGFSVGQSLGVVKRPTFFSFSISLVSFYV